MNLGGQKKTFSCLVSIDCIVFLKNGNNKNCFLFIDSNDEEVSALLIAVCHENGVAMGNVCNPHVQCERSMLENLYILSLNLF